MSTDNKADIGVTTHRQFQPPVGAGHQEIDLSSLDKDPVAKGNESVKHTHRSDEPEKIVPGAYSKPSQEELAKKLTSTQYKVTQCEGTEPPFANEYWNNHEEGLYVDVVTGEPLFSSWDKYDSGTGWPSFTKPVTADAITTKRDRSLFSERVEVRSRHGDSHLGHVFKDGPKDRGGLRYCMNSAALRFIPVSKMAEEGYGEFKPSVKKGY